MLAPTASKRSDSLGARWSQPKEFSDAVIFLVSSGSLPVGEFEATGCPRPAADIKHGRGYVPDRDETLISTTSQFRPAGFVWTSYLIHSPGFTHRATTSNFSAGDDGASGPLEAGETRLTVNFEQPKALSVLASLRAAASMRATHSGVLWAASLKAELNPNPRAKNSIKRPIYLPVPFNHAPPTETATATISATEAEALVLKSIRQTPLLFSA